MANQFTTFALTSAFLLLDAVVAVPWLGAMETPVGIEAAYAISPRPTEAPGLNGVPRELFKRSVIPYPPPSAWCGFVGGDSNSVLSCGPSYTCDFSGTAFGCCTNEAQYCTNLFTSCINYSQYSGSCNSSCRSNPLIIKCSDTATPYCGIYSWAGDSFLYNCQISPLSTQKVEYLGSWYATGSASTVDTTSASRSTSGSSASSDSSGPTQSGTAVGGTTNGPTSSPAQTASSSSDKGLAAGAIAGIAVGAGVLAIAAGILIFLCIRKRNSKRAAAAQNPPPRPPATLDSSQPMQQQNALGVPAGGYQGSPQPGLQPGQHQNGYTHPQSPVSTHATPATYPSSPTKSHFQNQNLDHRTSSATANPFSSVPSTISGSDNHNNGNSDGGFFHPSPSPTPAIPEVDGNSGRPDLQSQPSEVHGSTVSHGQQSYHQSQQQYNQTQQQYNQPPQQYNQPQQQYNQPQQQFNQSQQPYTQSQQGHHYGYAHEMPGAQPQPGPWELSNRE